MNKMLGRIAIRDNGSNKGDLIIGSLARSQKIFGPGDVWEIQQNVFDEDTITLVKVGKSCIGRTVDETVPGLSCCWGSDVGTILAVAGAGYFVLTRAEYEELSKVKNKSEDEVDAT